jgi:hypothetical protein
MCTVSIVPHDEGFRLVCNRDEALTRLPAIPPMLHSTRDSAAIYPVDPQGGGTWIGVNHHGVAVALLNRQHAGVGDTHRPSAASRWRSRGEIPVAVLAADSLGDARGRLAQLDPASYPPFLALVVSFDRLLCVRGDSARVTAEEQPLAKPLVFTSSSLGDARVEDARVPLFQSLVVNSRRPWEGQRLFHDHQWRGRPDVSVRMRRPDACTVSRTRVDVRGSRVSLDYEPLSRMR